MLTSPVAPTISAAQVSFADLLVTLANQGAKDFATGTKVRVAHRSCRPDLFLCMNRQVHVFYSGTVQGVGFRYTTEDFARDLGVTGWVRNVRDGRVEVLAEADEEVLKAFLEKIREYFGRYIRDVQEEWYPAGGGFKDFSITF